MTEMAIENLQPLAYVVASVAFAIGTCSIFLRLYCRWRLRLFGCDDFVAVALFVSSFDACFSAWPKIVILTNIVGSLSIQSSRLFSICFYI